MAALEVKDLVRVEVLRPPLNAFILGRSRVGDNLTAAGATLKWDDYTCDAKSVSINRGGDIEGVQASLDVGTATVEWYGNVPENLTGVLQPNFPFRVRTLDGKPLFTGTIDAIRKSRSRLEPEQRVTRKNLVPTPSFENGVGNWTGNNCNLTTTSTYPEMVGRVGTYILQATSTGTSTSMYPWAEFAIDPTAGAWVAYKGWVATDNAIRVRQVVYFYDAANALISPTVSGEWHTGAQFYEGRTVVFSTPVPPSAAKMRVYFTVTNATGSAVVPAGKRLWVDQVHVEQGASQAEAEALASTYFDGSTARTDAHVYGWTGLAHASVSTETYMPLSSVTITASDAVQSLANTTRYGAVTPGGAGYETWTKRVARLSESAKVSIEQPPPEEVQLHAILPTGSFAVTPYKTEPRVSVSASVYPNAGGHVTDLIRVQATVTPSSMSDNQTGRVGALYEDMTGLIVGQRYRIDIRLFNFGNASNFAIGIEGQGWEEGYLVPRTASISPVSGKTITRTFTATASSMYVYITTDEDTEYVPKVEFYAKPTVSRILTETAVQDVVFESNLVEHFNLVTNSARAAWWVDRSNVVQFAKKPGSGEVIANFSAGHNSADPLHVCYIEAPEELSTQNVVNNLTLSQHGRDAATGNAKDSTHLFVSETSEATWGPQAQTIETCVYDGGAWAGSLAVLGMDTLKSWDTPQDIVSSVSFDALKHPWILDSLDIYSKVTVHGVEYLVVGYETAIQPEQMLCTLTLRKVTE